MGESNGLHQKTMANLDRWVTPAVRRRVEALAAELEVFQERHCACVPAVLSELHDLLDLNVALSYRVVPDHDGWAFDFLHVHGDITKSHFSDVFGAALENAATLGAYDPVRPPRKQQNQVVRPRRLMPAQAWSDSAAGVAERALRLDVFDEMRVLICQGPTITAWVGGFRTEPFGKRDHALLAALVPALRRRLELERRLSSFELSEQTLDAVLEAIDAAAFVVRPSGHVTRANGGGRAMLQHANVKQALRDAMAGAPGYQVTPIGSPGMAHHYLITVDVSKNTSIERVIEDRRASWALTKRQTEILRRLIRGDRNQTIAGDLGVSCRTVEQHVSALLEKAGTHSRGQLIAAFWASR